MIVGVEILLILLTNCYNTFSNQNPGVCDKNGTKCCLNYYITTNKTCTECPPGLFGENCSNACPPGKFGRLCLQDCQSCRRSCDPVIGCHENGSYGTSFFQSFEWIATFSVTGSIVFIAIFTASCMACSCVKNKRKHSWQPVKSKKVEKKSAKKPQGTCCDVKNRTTSTRLPCKNCAMNPTGKVIVSDLPTVQTVSQEEAQAELPSHLYSTIGAEEAVSGYLTPAKTATFSKTPYGRGKDNCNNQIHLEIDEKYITVNKNSANNGLGTSDVYNTYFVLEKSENQNKNSLQDLRFTDDLPPPRF
ncbi:uncharacterized protein LOC128181993 [Crassostrea angulata]|uniref:uncharacterized protein LOC128181993 n=1 Tax=Magallana angulata TaxID=2784310 RepID=UPI0022B09C14|nr:uncharacterized protein LOC128181993 [Crassostrea angulata]